MTTTIAETFDARSLDHDTLLELARRSDSEGVLSIYLDARPGHLRASSIDITNRLAELQRGASGDDPSPTGRSLRDRIERLTDEIEQLTDPDEPGRGRVLFAGLGDPWITRVASQLPVSNRVVLDRSALIHPLLELLDEGGPAGVLLASRTEARMLEWRLGELMPLREFRAAVIVPRHERSGPVGSRPARRSGTPTGEQRNARERTQTTRFLERISAEAARLAHDRGWEQILIGGGEHLTDPLIRVLPAALRAKTVRDPRILLRHDHATLEELVNERIQTAHHELERRLVETLRDKAHGASVAALGPSEVVGALNQARVAHLVYDPWIRYRGSVGADGTLYANDEKMLTGGTRSDSRLTERMVERALETGARVTPVEGAASDGLAEAAGVAAVLRW